MNTGSNSLDVELLEEIRSLQVDGEPSLLAELIDLFFEDSPARFHELERAVNNGDLQQAGRLAHGLKGSCGSLGAVRLSEMFGRAERRASEGNLPPQSQVLSDLRQEFDVVVEALKLHRIRENA
jgi:HPt (histidine-containing phosphotransfer) domain-containing protein